eukprot:6211232-Pleurochrysis_carterae.AAC.4
MESACPFDLQKHVGCDTACMCLQPMERLGIDERLFSAAIAWLTSHLQGSSSAHHLSTTV